MKTMLALALVGLLSISSLAEAQKQKKVQPNPVVFYDEYDELDCPKNFVKIDGSGVVDDFCISERDESILNTVSAESNCERKIFNESGEFNDTKAHLCDEQERILACRQGVLGDNFFLSCNSSNVNRRNGSRCCFR